MNKEDRINELTKFLNNEENMKKISNAATKEEMIKYFGDFGIEMSMDDIDTFIYSMNNVDENEMTEENLETVTGGAGVDAIWIIEKSCQTVCTVAKTCWKAGRWFARNVG